MRPSITVLEQLKKLLRARVGQHFTFLSFDALAVSFASG
jgi:hypothetical protein